MSENFKIEYLDKSRISDFVSYCYTHKLEIDESLLCSEDLNSFEPNMDNPTYIAVNNKNEIVGVVSLFMDEYLRRGNRGRFRIFHSVFDNSNIYKSLFDKILNHVSGIEYLNIFFFSLSLLFLDAILLSKIRKIINIVDMAIRIRPVFNCSNEKSIFIALITMAGVVMLTNKYVREPSPSSFSIPFFRI